jgi:hypothetical protein
MPILSSQLLFMYSTASGSAGNTTAQANPNASLGGYMSTTQWTGGTLNDLFSDITGDENASGQVDYRCIFLQNTNGTLTLLSPVLWIASEVAGGATIALGMDPTPASAIGSSSAQSVTVANTLTAPSGVTFSSPTTFNTGISMGNLPAGQCVAFWFKRTATNSAALNNDGVTINEVFALAA